jgi:hypothetical protein
MVNGLVSAICEELTRECVIRGLRFLQTQDIRAYVIDPFLDSQEPSFE